jgi:hypothetical protein
MATIYSFAANQGLKMEHTVLRWGVVIRSCKRITVTNLKYRQVVLTDLRGRSSAVMFASVVNP